MGFSKKKVTVIAGLVALALGAVTLLKETKTNLNPEINPQKIEQKYERKKNEKTSPKATSKKDITEKNIEISQKILENVAESLIKLENKIEKIREDDDKVNILREFMFYDIAWFLTKDESSILQELYIKYFVHLDKMLSDIESNLSGQYYSRIDKLDALKILKASFKDRIEELEKAIQKLEEILAEINSLVNIKEKEYEDRVKKMRLYIERLIKVLEFSQEKYIELIEQYSQVYEDINVQNK